MIEAARELLDYWFGPYASARWFKTDPAFDDALRARFGSLVESAARGELASWSGTADTALALVLVFDQLPRNLFRGSARAFALDAHARDVANRAIASGYDLAIELERRRFLYVPFEHSESLADQDRSLALFEGWARACAGTLDAAAADELTYVRAHRETIVRFGRFPARNAALGRATTPDEARYLASI